MEESTTGFDDQHLEIEVSVSAELGFTDIGGNKMDFTTRITIHGWQSKEQKARARYKLMDVAGFLLSALPMQLLKAHSVEIKTKPVSMVAVSVDKEKGLQHGPADALAEARAQQQELLKHFGSPHVETKQQPPPPRPQLPKTPPTG